MPQFSPIIVCFVFLFVWTFFLLLFVSLWWTGKRFYGF